MVQFSPRISLLKKFVSIPRRNMSLTINVLVNDTVNGMRSSGLQPMVSDTPLYAIPLCSCPQSRKGIVIKMTETLQKTF
jgi:hypothetical protein